MATTKINGDLHDLSQYSHTLANNNVVTYDTEHLFSYASFGGVNQSLTYPDSAGFRILGNEAHIAGSLRGLTMFAWVRPLVASQVGGVIGKWDGSISQFSYFLSQNGAVWQASINGGIFQQSTQLSVNNWHFLALRYIPSTSLDIWVASSVSGVFTITKSTNTTGIPATITNSTAAFSIGSAGGNIAYLNGDVAAGGVYSAALPESRIETILYSSKAPILG